MLRTPSQVAEFARTFRPTRRRGFTLVEVVLVVVILGTLAAIAIPRLSGASDRARVAAVQDDLRTMQSAIGFYAAEHREKFPTLAGIVKQLTMYSDLAGDNASEQRDAAHPYGPYLREIPAVPLGPWAGSNVIAGATGDDVAWIYNEVTGRINANVPGLKPGKVELAAEEAEALTAEDAKK